jgi:hypothetical protein
MSSPDFDNKLVNEKKITMENFMDKKKQKELQELARSVGKALTDAKSIMSKKFPSKKFTKAQVNKLCSTINKDMLFNHKKYMEQLFDEVESKWTASISKEDLVKYSNWILDYFDLNLIVGFNNGRQIIFMFHDYDDKLYDITVDQSESYFNHICSVFNMKQWIFEMMHLFHIQMNLAMGFDTDKNWSFKNMKEAFEEATYYTEQYFIDME